MNEDYMGYQEGLAARYTNPGLDERSQNVAAVVCSRGWKLQNLEEFVEGWKRGYCELRAEEAKSVQRRKHS